MASDPPGAPPPAAHVTMLRHLGGSKRKRNSDPCEEKDEGGEVQDFRPLKRVSPFLNTPKQRKEEKRKVLRMSYEKLRAIDDPEKCLLRSVLVHNTARKMQRELMQEGRCWAGGAMLGTPLGCPPGIPPLGYPGDLYQDRFLCRPRHLSCEFEVLNNSYLYSNAHLFVDSFSQANGSDMEDIGRDDLSRVLEQSLESSKNMAAGSLLDQHADPGHKLACHDLKPCCQRPVDNNNGSGIKEVSKEGCLSPCARSVNHCSNAQVQSSPFSPAAPVPKRPLSASSSSSSSQTAVWDYQAYAANLTGAPLFTGSITMGIPVNKDHLASNTPKSQHHPISATAAAAAAAAMDTDSSRPDTAPAELGSSSGSSSSSSSSSRDSAFRPQGEADTSAMLASPQVSSALSTPSQCQEVTSQTKDCCSTGPHDLGQDSGPVHNNSECPPTSMDTPSHSPHQCECGKTVEHSSCSKRLVTSATTLATFSHELDSLMTDYFSRSSTEPSRPLSCAYLSGVHSDSERDTCTARQTDSMDSVLNSLVPVLGGI